MEVLFTKKQFFTIRIEEFVGIFYRKVISKQFKILETLIRKEQPLRIEDYLDMKMEQSIRIY